MAQRGAPTRCESVGCDEGNFSFPEELQIVALLQAILKQSYILATDTQQIKKLVTISTSLQVLQYLSLSTRVLTAKY